MKSFKDTAGRNWQVAINVGSIKRVRDQAEIDLTTVLDPKANLLERLSNDPVLLVDVLWILVAPQAEKLGVSDEQFGEGLGGDALEAATTAFLEALADFFPSGRRRVLRDLIAKMGDLQQKASAAASQRLTGDLGDRLLAKELAKVDAQLAAQLGEPPATAAADPPFERLDALTP